MRKLCGPVTVGLAAAAGLSSVFAVGAAGAASPAPLPPERAAATITAAALRGQIRFLADDLLGGRQPGSPGDALSRAYLRSQLESLGLQPAGEVVGGQPSYFQWVQMVGARSSFAAPPLFKSQATTVPVKVAVPPQDVVLVAGQQTPTSQVQDAEVVFVGYGITAPEYQWDDYKGVDLRGKILLMLNNDPADDPALFAGKTRLYYGRWDYKYEEAARHGAAGALIIHTTASAGYPWSVVRSSWDSENFDPPQAPQEVAGRLRVRGWLTLDASRRVTQAGGQDLDALIRRAERRDFHPVPLGMSLSVQLRNELRRVSSANVVAVLPGTDARLRAESVVYTAHFDHLGIHPEQKGEDKIHNGALDNASGVAALLSLARAAVLGPAPRRSLVFAALTGEEDGLIGSAVLVKRAAELKVGTMVADINMDGLNVYGRSPHVVQIGRGKSSLDAVLDGVAAGQGRKVLPDQMPDRGSFYRSDQFNFARVGIPALYLGAPRDLYGANGQVQQGAGQARVEDYIQHRYHQPTDELRDDWNFDGAVQDLQLLYLAGLRIANAAQRPTFRAGDEFAHK